MPDYKTVRMTKQEYEVFESIKEALAEKGLPKEIFDIVGATDVNNYLEVMKRESLNNGTLAGMGLCALLHLINKKE